MTCSCWTAGLTVFGVVRRRVLTKSERAYLMDSGVMLSILGEEVANCCLCFIHFDVLVNYVIVVL